MVLVDKIDSNSTGLRVAEEASLGVLPAAADQVWHPLEPNSYSDFGGQITTIARRPINASRQNQKGVVTDLDASGGYNTDITQNNLTFLERGFFFARVREMYDSQSIDNEVSDVDSAVAADDTFNLFYGDDLASPKIIARSLLMSSGFSTAANNGVNVVNSVTRAKAAGTLTLTPGAIADDVVEIGGVYYKFAADPTTGTPTGLVGSPFLVDVGVDDETSLENLLAAINNSGTPGTTYSEEINTLYPDGHPTVIATASDATTLDVEARRYGTAGNAISTTTTVAGGDDGLDWGGLVLSGGTAAIDVAANLTDEGTPLAAARVQVVGYQFASATLDVSMSFTYPRLVRASGAVDFTTLGLVAGQFIFIGGDGASEDFVNTVNNGWARVRSVAAAYIELDKTTSTMVAETGTGLTISIFYGKVLKNETAESGLIVPISFQFERDLGQKDTAIADHQGEYIVGAMANEYTLNTQQADKLNADLAFVAIDNETVDQATGLKSATAPAVAPSLVSEDAFNTSTHVARLRMTILESGNANPDALWGFCTEFTVTINNNVTPSKAVSRLGAFAVTAGQFEVGGSVTAYFSDVAAVQAVRSNEDVSFDAIFARDNYGVAFDIPLIALGDARLNVEQDSEIQLPLEMNAAEDRLFHHTLLKVIFPYLPDAAMPS